MSTFGETGERGLWLDDAAHRED
ncbi:MAG: hypothetical protein QOJ95_484, partial [Mycobacterium sp.]|nr:hypothetical protein [Mycobacterium sp.]